MTYSPQQTSKAKKFAEKCKDPVWFSDNVLGGIEYNGHTVWEKQIEVMQSILDNTHTTVRSGHGVGKSHISARIVIWFLMAFRPSKVITTAPTWNQVENVLWAEINAIYKRSKIPIGGTILKTKLEASDDHFAIGFSTNEPDKHNDNRRLHHICVLYIALCSVNSIGK